MVFGFRPGVFLSLLFVFSAVCIFAQSSAKTAPPSVPLPPKHGEAPRFPYDFRIGELGRGGADFGAYEAAKRILAALGRGQEEGLPEHIKEAAAVLKDLELRLVRVGGGRTEDDGSASFLVRFLGREASVAGECRLKAARGEETVQWLLDDLILDGVRPLGEGSFGPASGEMKPYDRFF